MKLKRVWAWCLGPVMAAVMSSAGWARDNLMLSYDEPEYSVLGYAALKFSEKIEELSEGRMTVSTFPEATLAILEEMPTMVRDGSCDMAFIPTALFVRDIPDLGVMDLPFLFENYADAERQLNHSQGTDYIKQRFLEQNIRFMGMATTGFRVLTSREEITPDIKSLAKKTMRIQNNPYHHEIFEGLGMIPVVIRYADLTNALNHHTVVAQENPYINIFNHKYYESQKYLADTNHLLQGIALVLSNITYDELSDEERDWVNRAAEYAIAEEWKVAEDENERARQALLKKGMKMVQFDHEALYRATAPMRDQHAGEYGALIKLMHVPLDNRGNY